MTKRAATFAVLWAVVANCTGDATDYAEARLALPDGTTGQVLRCDTDSVVFRTRSGIRTLDWWDLEPNMADAIGRKLGLYRIIDQRERETESGPESRTIVARKMADGRAHYAIIQNKARDHWIHKEYLHHDPPYFVDLDTIVTLPNHASLAFRDFDRDGKAERISIQRNVVTTNMVVIDDDPHNQREHTWRTAFSADGIRYLLRILSKELPAPPEPHPNEGWLKWRGKEYRLTDLKIHESRRTDVVEIQLPPPNP